MKAECRRQKAEVLRFFSTFCLLTSAFLSSCAPAAPTNVPNDREWSLLTADHQWLETLRKAQVLPPATASRKQQIEARLANMQKVEPVYVAFMDKLKAYFDRTHDPRAGKLLATEKAALADEYVNVLARYDRALDFYRDALQFDPSNESIRQRMAAAEKRRFVSMSAFAAVKSGMKEDEVRSLVGLPREDWIKQVVQNSRVYSVWIYPKSDGGASAVYFDNGVVYHTNWNAAPPAQTQSTTR
jgi:tetratricopeptide (TPR) repeat protein